MEHAALGEQGLRGIVRTGSGDVALDTWGSDRLWRRPGFTAGGPVRLLGGCTHDCFFAGRGGDGYGARGAPAGSPGRDIAWPGSSNEGSFSRSRDWESQGKPL